MATHFDPQRTRLYGREFRWTALTRLWGTVVGVCVALLGFLSPVGCSRWTGKEEPPLPPVVITIDWSEVLARKDNEVPMGISGRLMTWSSDEPHHTLTYMLSGTVEGHSARGCSVRPENDSGQEMKEVYHVLGSLIREEGHPIVVIEGTSEVAWQLKVVKEGDSVIVARQGEKESSLPLDLQPGPFHIRIEAREQKKTK